MENKEPEWELIYSYTDAEALEDGVLVAIDRIPVNRVNRAVFDHFTTPMDGSADVSAVTDVTRLMQAVESMLKLEPDGHGWGPGHSMERSCGSFPTKSEDSRSCFPRITNHKAASGTDGFSLSKPESRAHAQGESDSCRQ